MIYLGIWKNVSGYIDIYRDTDIDFFLLNNWQSLHPDYEAITAGGSECAS